MDYKVRIIWVHFSTISTYWCTLCQSLTLVTFLCSSENCFQVGFGFQRQTGATNSRQWLPWEVLFNVCYYYMRWRWFKNLFVFFQGFLMPNQVWEEDCEAVQGASPAKVWIRIFLRREQLWCPTPTKGAGLLSINIQRYTSSAFLKQCFPFPARKHSNFGASLLVGVCSVADSQ